MEIERQIKDRRCKALCISVSGAGVDKQHNHHVIASQHARYSTCWASAINSIRSQTENDLLLY